MKKYWLVLGIFAAVFTTPASADGGYAGIGVGSSRTDITSGGATTSYTATGFNLLGGYKINSNFSIEGEYVNLGSFTSSVATVDASGFGLSVVGIAPLGSSLSLFGKLGIANTTTTATPAPGIVLLVPADQSKTGTSWGLGAEYAITPAAAVRLSFNSYEYSALAGTITGRAGFYNLAGIFSF